MYYEEKFINGKLMFRTMPDADWNEKTTAVAIVANQVMKLNQAERVELFELFCTLCGADNPNCSCWNQK